MGNFYSTYDNNNDTNYPQALIEDDNEIKKIMDEFVKIGGKSEEDKYLIVLDIDGCLIHRLFNKKRKGKKNYNKLIKNKNPSFTIRDGLYDIYKRPFLDDFLDFLFKHYKIAIWGDAVKWNINALTEKLFPDVPGFNNGKSNLEFVWSIDNMIDKELKSIDIIEKYSNQKWNRTNTIIIEDNNYKIAENTKQNTIIIPSYQVNNDEWDCVLLLLKKFLESNITKRDAREVIQNYVNHKK